MTINCKGTLIDLSTSKVMGILNLTPDSFYDGGKFKNVNSILAQVKTMLDEGATFIDLGGYSSRPGAEHVSRAEEIIRVLPIVKLLTKELPDILLSIDTFRSEVAQICLENGAAIINDISGGSMDADMMKTIAKFQVPYIMMHMQGTPQNMQQQTNYDDLVGDILKYFATKISEARALKINDIIIDPGFGFAKTLEQNFELLKKLELLQIIELPVLVGVSRKSMIYKSLEIEAATALNGTTALNMYALNKGASILRVHDVKEAMQCIKLHKKLEA